MDDYFPFDFGSWQSDKGVTCPRHGVQHGGLILKVVPVRNGPAHVKHYCGLCVLDMLDQFCGMK
jgi:hypothetical protein